MVIPLKIKSFRYFTGDFETTVFKGQTFTEVWASASVELYTEDVKIFHSIDEQFDYFKSLKQNVCCYYHNLKFDGSFWLSFLLTKLKMKQAYTVDNENPNVYTWLSDTDMPNNSVKYSISDRGQWYYIRIKINNHFIEFRDSLKLLPFSVKRIGESFGTKHKKKDIEYEGFRYAGCEITEHEKEYISNDVLVVKEALEILFNEGHKKLTIGSCCFSEFKNRLDKSEFATYFPDLSTHFIDEKIHKYDNADKWIRRSYRGGWCYLVEGKERKVMTNGVTFDVNSLYPSMMHSESGNRYPVGEPVFWVGDYIPDKALRCNRYFFVRIKTQFYLKSGKLPFIQIKGSLLYPPNVSLKTSDLYDPVNDEYYSQYTDKNGETHNAVVELTLTMTDYALLKEHYHLVNFQILDGCYFDTEIGIFDDYINHYRNIKVNSKGAKREFAKLFLNNLYGKMATNSNSSFKIAYTKEDNSIGFIPVLEFNKKVGYIPIGSAITSYARNFTIRSAQLNYHGKNKRGFIYADTDSIHCDLTPDEVKGIRVHDYDFCAWKMECTWDKAFFTRQKTYIEHITSTDTPYYDIKCAGMPKRSKDIFNDALLGIKCTDTDTKYTDNEKEFLNKKDYTLNDFDIGLKVPSKLLPKRINGGIVLVETTYEMR